MIVEAEEANSHWHAFLGKFLQYEPHARHEEPLASLLAKLKGKTYWAVKFSTKAPPNVDVFDGTLFVFVDAESGTVLGVIS